MSVDQKKARLVRIVDDDAAVRRALARLVESMGLRAETFASPDDLLKQPQADDVDCLVLDVQLPGMDGFELNERVRASGNMTPVIFISAHVNRTTRKRAEAAEAVAFIEKPFEDELLFAAVRKAIDRLTF